MSSPLILCDGSSLSHDDFPHLLPFEWEGLRRLADISGITVVAALLYAGSNTQQHAAIQEFLAREHADLRRRASTPSPPKTDVVKLNMSSYSGEGPHRLALSRWLCEVDIAVHARQLKTELGCIHFLLSKLSGKAKEWALGHLVSDPGCFLTLESLKSDLRLAFEPLQDESQLRLVFLALLQGRSSMLDYIQQARHLATCIVKDPIYMVTQVHVFVHGMNAGHQRFYLTRKPPTSLEEAFATALREDYTVRASRHQAQFPRVDEHEHEPMEIDAIERSALAQRGMKENMGRGRNSAAKLLTCFRCPKIGHRAAECRAPGPVLAVVDAHGEVCDTVSPGNAEHQ